MKHLCMASLFCVTLLCCAPDSRTPHPSPRPHAAPDWLARAGQGLAAREYHATENDRGLQAPNRRHNLRTYFEPDGIRVVDRTAPGGPGLVGLRLAGVGRGTTLHPVPPGEVYADAARVEIRRPGLVEWFENGPDGLEQGFDLEVRPAGRGPLVLALEVEGALASLRGDAIALATATGRTLQYAKLAAWDSRGEVLEARLRRPSSSCIEIALDDAGARYPIRIDPLLSESSDTLLESDQVFADFGVSVASAGDVNGDGFADVIVGAPSFDSGQDNEGAAFIFLGSASGVPDAGAASAQTQLEGDQSFARLGHSVASAGDVNGDGFADVIVGAHFYDSGETNEGAAFVFLGGPGGIADAGPATAHAQLEGDQPGSLLGWSVASAGDVNGDGFSDVVVGASSYDAGEVDEGAAFVFLGGPAGVADGSPTTAHTQLEGNQASANFGHSVAAAGDVDGDGFGDLIVGAYLYDVGEIDEGAAFVFRGSATGIADGGPATADAQLESEQAAATLGFSVASAGDVDGDGYGDVIVGAPLFDAPTSSEGAAFVFLGSATGIADGNPATAHAQLEGNLESARMGFSVASAGDLDADGFGDVVVGADLYDGLTLESGAVFVFLGGATGIGDGSPATAYAELPGTQTNARMGISVASAGDVDGDGFADLIVGARMHDAGQEAEGAAFVYLGGAARIEDANPATADTRLESNQVGARLGISVAAAGDVNADGFGDVIVGADSYDAGQTDEGAAFVFLGGPTGIADAIPLTAHAQLESDQAGADWGDSVASAGDVNGDGYADVIVGAPLYDDGEVDEGAAFVFLGGPTGVAHGNPSTAHAVLEGNQASAAMGTSVASAGDVDGDGFADTIVGASTYDAGELQEGAAFVFRGSAAGIAGTGPATADARLESDQVNALLGTSVASAGDVNGDGFADVIVGASGYDAGETNEGAAFVFQGGPLGIADGNPATADARIVSGQAGASLGIGVSGAGDVNGDGFADVIVGANAYDLLAVDDGLALIVHGSPSGIPDAHPGSAPGVVYTDQADARLGFSVSGAGDVDGDGYADVLVGASRWDGPLSSEGSGFLFRGGASGIQIVQAFLADAMIEGDQAGARMGISVAGAGDVDGDGLADVIVGAHTYDAGQQDEGAAFVLLGGELSGRTVDPHPTDPISGARIPPWGSSSIDRFDVSLTATDSQGRGNVKLEVEWCPAGVAFGDLSCDGQTSASWTDVTATPGGVVLTESLPGLTPDQLYRWRARVLRAPLHVTAPGVVEPPNPAHGPWRRPGGQQTEADVRVVPEPGALVGLAAGVLLLASLARRRSGLACLLVALGSLGVAPDSSAQSVPGFALDVYATVTDPMKISFDTNGDLFTGRDNSGSGGGFGDAVPIHLVESGGSPVREYGNGSIPDPDAVVVDTVGIFGTPGAVLMGGIVSNSSGGQIASILLDESVVALFGPTTLWHNVSDMAFDGFGRLLFTNHPNPGTSTAGIYASSGALDPPALLAATGVRVAGLAVDPSSDDIYVSTEDGRIQIYDPNGTLVDANFVIGLAQPNPPLTVGQLDGGPLAVFTVTGDGELLEVDLLGNETTIGTGFATVSDLAFGPDGDLYIAEFDQDRVLRVPEPDGMLLAGLGLLALLGHRRLASMSP